ncbi:MAG: hypothetical protein ABS977_06835 [Pseudomonas qingdaonensis]|uniref:hypothetical protein n=1 Tax=Pseudomonas qingdaonensis TaxID=2056231 RepID=UPI003314AE57
MSVEKQCASCNKSLAGKRSHAITCGSTCRGIQWRANKEPLIPVKLAFSVTNFEAIKNSANAAGKSIKDYVHDRVIQNECAQ